MSSYRMYNTVSHQKLKNRVGLIIIVATSLWHQKDAMYTKLKVWFTLCNFQVEAGKSPYIFYSEPGYHTVDQPTIWCAGQRTALSGSIKLYPSTLKLGLDCAFSLLLTPVFGWRSAITLIYYFRCLFRMLLNIAIGDKGLIIFFYACQSLVSMPLNCER